MALEPDEAELLRRAFASLLSDVWTAEAVIVKSYDSTARTVDVQPAVMRPVELLDDDGAFDHEPLPIVPNVPVLFPQAGPVLITFPIAAGDEGVLFVCSSAPAKFRETGQVAQPGDLRRHHLGAGFFYPSGLSRAKVTGTQGAANALVVNAPTIVLGGPAAALYVAIGDYVDARLATVASAHDTHTHPDPATGDTGPPSVLVGSLASVKSARVKIEA